MSMRRFEAAWKTFFVVVPLTLLVQMFDWKSRTSTPPTSATV